MRHTLAYVVAYRAAGGSGAWYPVGTFPTRPDAVREAAWQRAARGPAATVRVFGWAEYAATARAEPVTPEDDSCPRSRVLSA